MTREAFDKKKAEIKKGSWNEIKGDFAELQCDLLFDIREKLLNPVDNKVEDLELKFPDVGLTPEIKDSIVAKEVSNFKVKKKATKKKAKK